MILNWKKNPLVSMVCIHIFQQFKTSSNQKCCADIHPIQKMVIESLLAYQYFVVCIVSAWLTITRPWPAPLSIIPALYYCPAAELNAHCPELSPYMILIYSGYFNFWSLITSVLAGDNDTIPVWIDHCFRFCQLHVPQVNLWINRFISLSLRATFKASVGRLF